jgi:FixJ family two-component response regulator
MMRCYTICLDDRSIPVTSVDLAESTRSREKSVPKNVVIHVVDDDAGMRTGLCRLLEAVGYEARPYASPGDYLLHDPGDTPGCVLLDVRMPGPSGLELQQALARRSEPLPVVFLTGHGDVPTSVQALKGGAVDFLTKPVKRDTLLAAVENALAQDAAGRAEREAVRVLQARYETITAREREVLTQVVAGRLNKQIAGEIGAAERTVKAHRARVMEKMGFESVADLVRAAGRLSLPQAGSTARLRGETRT